VKRIGIISDTHGWLDPQVKHLFAGVDHIIHAGDIGQVSVLDELAALAPVTAVSGNVDWSSGSELADLPAAAQLDIAGVRFVIAHIRAYITQSWNLSEYGVRVAVYGHSHRAEIDWRDDILFLNPGSAGAVRFGLPRSVAVLVIDGDDLRPRITNLEQGAAAALRR
jgi:putative phosphoesterase